MDRYPVPGTKGHIVRLMPVWYSCEQFMAAPVTAPVIAPVTVPHSPKELEQIYQHRFGEHMAYRDRVWRVLTSKFFSRLIRPDSTILDLGCGYGEFINNIRAAKKFAMDMNPGAAERLNRDVTHIEQDCSTQWNLPADHLDAVFTSNFFEHLPSKTALSDTLAQARRCLKDG